MPKAPNPQQAQVPSIPPPPYGSSPLSRARSKKRFRGPNSLSPHSITVPSKACPPNPSAKSRLTAHQKSDNHKEAENRRRNGIRDQYIALSHLVPDTEGQAKSEEKMLVKTAEYMKQLLEDRRGLTGQLIDMGGNVTDLLLPENEWGGSDWEPKCEEDYLKKRAERIAEQGYDEADDGCYERGASSG